MDTSSNTRLQIHYDAMWDRAFSAAVRGDVDCDTHLTAGRDPRRGLTLIARPDQALRARFDSLVDRLAGSEPHQYCYPVVDMHVTILSLFTVTENPAPQLLRLADYCTSVRTALDGIEAFEIDFHGITMSRGAVIAQGFPRGPALETLRERLRAELCDKGIGASLDQRYRLVTAHTTLFRFISPLQGAQRFTALLESLRHEPLGCMVVNEVELVTNDWYMSSNSVERVALMPLRTPALGTNA
jgi:2'-5' RNA ligase